MRRRMWVEETPWACGGNVNGSGWLEFAYFYVPQARGTVGKARPQFFLGEPRAGGRKPICFEQPSGIISAFLTVLMFPVGSPIGVILPNPDGF